MFKLLSMKKKSFIRKCHFRPKLAIILLLAAMAMPSFSQISLNVRNQPFRQALKEIENVSNYRFFYNESLPILDKNSTIQVSNSNIDEVMQKLLPTQSYSALALKQLKKGPEALPPQIMQK